MRAGVVTVLLALLAAPAAASAQSGSTLDPAPGAQAAARGLALPGNFAVRGAPLARRRKVVAGRSISVYARPAAVVVEGCRSRSTRVRVRRGRASLSVVARCKGVPGPLRIRATIRGARMRGTAASRRKARRFTARQRAPRGRLLRGRRSARALGSVRDVELLRRHSDAEVSRARGGGNIARTEIVLRFEPDATVGQVNAALRAAGGRIVGSLADSPKLLVAIPDPGSLAVLDSLLRRLGRMRGVERADRAEMAASQELPPGFGAVPSAGSAAELSHLLALRMPAAWNARGAIRVADRPALIVADVFGNGPLSPRIDATVDQSALSTGSPDAHGYHVTGIAASSFANNGTPAGRVTGVFPATARLQVIDVVGFTLDGAGLLVRQAVSGTPGRVVVNTSLGHQSPTTEAYARQEGSDWAQDIRSAGLVDRLLHAASAGNSAAPATANSPWVSAALRTDLTDIDGFPAARLTNTLAVENLKDTGAPAYTPGCLGTSSNRGGNLAAVGTDVFSHLLGGNVGNKTGTSMASPQVAGLAEYLWSIAPDLTAPQLVATMIATAAPPLPNDAGNCGTDLPSAPRMDAYAAVLSLDDRNTLTPAAAPVRLAILDVDGDGAFDQQDISAFVAAHTAGPADRDWSRADLNGDGFTGGGSVAPFDLDPRGSLRGGAPVFASTGATIEGFAIDFEETAVTDTEVLCFYAYSALYSGSEAGRKQALDPESRCDLPPETDEISGRYAGTAVSCVEGEGCSPGPGRNTIGVLTLEGSQFTLLYQETTIREPDPAICGTRFDQFCIKVTGTRSGSTFTGTGTNGSRSFRFNATLTDKTMTGTIFEDVPSGAEGSQFTLTRP